MEHNSQHNGAYEYSITHHTINNVNKWEQLVRQTHQTVRNIPDSDCEANYIFTKNNQALQHPTE